MALPAEAFQTITWREGATEPLSGRFAACACGAPAAMQARHGYDHFNAC